MSEESSLEEELTPGNEIKLNDIAIIIKKIRSIVKLFKKSSIKNETLQKYVMENFNRELGLVLDIRIRWSSMIVMLKRIHKLKDCIQKAMIDLKIPCELSEKDFALLEKFLNVLIPLEIVHFKLLERETDLLLCEGVFKFLKGKLLDEENLLFGIDIYSKINSKLAGRKNLNLVELMEFFVLGEKNGRNATVSDLNEKHVNSFEKLKLFAVDTFERLYCKDGLDLINDQNVQIDNTAKNDYVMKMDCSNEDELEKELSKYRDSKKIKFGSDQQGLKLNNKENFKREMELFEKTGKKTENILNLIQALKSIPATSLDSERTFSLIGSFLNKESSKMGIDLLDSIILIKSYKKSHY